MMKSFLIWAGGAAIMWSGATVAQEADKTFGTDFAVSRDNVPSTGGNYSPFAGQKLPNRVFWGDSHLHTSYSWDAGLMYAILTPEIWYAPVN